MSGNLQIEDPFGMDKSPDHAAKSFCDLPYDTKDMLVKQSGQIKESLMLCRKAMFKGDWFAASEDMAALITAAEYIRDECKSQHEKGQSDL